MAVSLLLPSYSSLFGLLLSELNIQKEGVSILQVPRIKRHSRVRRCMLCHSWIWRPVHTHDLDIIQALMYKSTDHRSLGKVICDQPGTQYFEAPESGSQIENPVRLVLSGGSEDNSGGSESLGDLIFRLNRVLARRPLLSVDGNGSLGSAPPDYEGDDDGSWQQHSG